MVRALDVGQPQHLAVPRRKVVQRSRDIASDVDLVAEIVVRGRVVDDLGLWTPSPEMVTHEIGRNPKEIVPAMGLVLGVEARSQQPEVGLLKEIIRQRRVAEASSEVGAQRSCGSLIEGEERRFIHDDLDRSVGRGHLRPIPGHGEGNHGTSGLP